MIFSSPLFIIFFALVFFIYWFVIHLAFPEKNRNTVKHGFLLIASYYFYMYWDWRFGFLILFSTVIDFYTAQAIDYYRKKGNEKGSVLFLWLSVGINLGVLAYFKYTDFFIASFVDLINAILPGSIAAEKNSLLLNLILPLGISFFTFQSMSYTIDVYRKVIDVEKSFLKFSLFVSFFPQLVAGPIVIAKYFIPQLKLEPKFDTVELRIAGRWFLLGFFKKTVIADNLASIVDQIYSSPDKYGSGMLWLASAAFLIQVYCDFSGYSDMAWGTAGALGYKLPENFRMPFRSQSITEFWQNWHISLVKWIRDYLYIPLGGNRVSAFRHKVNILLIMFATGFWHGASWTFVFWGISHGVLMVFENILGPLLRKERNSFLSKTVSSIPAFIQKPVMLLYTLFFVILTGVFFRSSTLDQAFLIQSRMLMIDYIPDLMPSREIIRVFILSLFAVFIGHYLGDKIFNQKKFRFQIPAILETIFYPVAVLILTQISASDVEAFVYFVF